MKDQPGIPLAGDADLSGSAPPRHPARQTLVAVPSTWTPDGDRIVFWGGTATNPTGLYSITPSGKDLRLLFKARREMSDMVPDISADGRWLILDGVFWDKTPLFLFDLTDERLFQLTDLLVGEARWRPSGG